MAFKSAIYKSLVRSVEGVAHRVLIGINWTAVEGSKGTGLCHTAVRGSNGCRDLPDSGNYCGRKLQDLSQMIFSDNPFEKSIAFAAINAHYNRYDLKGDPINGLELAKSHGADTVIIGRFPDIDNRLPRAKVVDRGFNLNYYPEESAKMLLPKAQNVIITGSALSNGSLPRLLRLSKKAFTTLVGPSAPFSQILFEYGVDAISGFVVSDTNKAIKTIMEGGATRALQSCGQKFTIFRTDPAPRN